MARAKSTERAAARRRHRAAQAAARRAEATEDVEDAAEPGAAEGQVEQPRQPLVRLPDVRADLAALPEILRTTRLIWLAFALMPIAAAVAFIVPLQPGATDPTVGSIVTLFLQLCLLPQATIPTFLAGFVTPRAAYLVGLLIGIVNAALVLLVVTRLPDSGNVPIASTVALIVVTDTVLCAFASWYRRFLRNTQERQRAAREAREREKRKQQRAAGRRPSEKGAAR